MAMAKNNKRQPEQSNFWGYIAIAGVAIGGIWVLTDPMFRHNIILLTFMLCVVAISLMLVISKLLGKAKEWDLEVDEKERNKIRWARGPLAPIINTLIIVGLGALGIGTIIYLRERLIGYLVFFGIIYGIIFLINRIIAKQKRNKPQDMNK